MNLFPQRGEYLDCNFLNAAIGASLRRACVTSGAIHWTKKEFLTTLFCRIAKRQNENGIGASIPCHATIWSEKNVIER